MALDETGASRRTTASTAEGAALLRAAGARERDPKVRNPDVLAAGFVNWGLRLPALVKVPGLRRLVPRMAERRTPGVYYFEIARTKHIDAVLRAELRRGIRQLVLLGAGYDSRPYRMADELRDVAVFEVDLPVMSAIKRGKVAQIVGDPPTNVRYVEIDFTTQDLGERLAASGHDPEAATLFIWSGVAPYLPEDAVREVLAFVGAQRSPDTSIVFDYCFREVVEGDVAHAGARKLLARLAEMGEPVRSGIPRGRTAEYLAELGLGVEEDLGADDAVGRYLTRSDGSVHGRPPAIGGLVHARAGAPAA
jgi:methyltransferase (TIGR00027 family)